MNTVWLISYLSLWVVVLFLAIVVVTLAQQLGLLQLRLGPSGARMTNDGPDIGETAFDLDVLDIRGESVELGSKRGRRTLLVFLSPTCRTCGDLTPALRSIFRNEDALMDLVVISLKADEAANVRFIGAHGLEGIHYVVSPELALRYKISGAPYGVLIDENGVVSAKGIVNNIIHLESLLEAQDLAHSSIESFIRSRKIPTGGAMAIAHSQRSEKHRAGSPHELSEPNFL